jgi:hypothetical protein
MATVNFETFAAHHSSIELSEERIEKLRAIGGHLDPVRFAIRTRDVTVQAHGHRISDSSHDEFLAGMSSFAPAKVRYFHGAKDDFERYRASTNS